MNNFLKKYRDLLGIYLKIQLHVDKFINNFHEYDNIPIEKKRIQYNIVMIDLDFVIFKPYFLLCCNIEVN